MSRIALHAGLLLVMLAGVGCHKTKPPPPMVDVSFSVAYADGKPVTDMMLTLHPQDSDLERPSPRAVDQSGKCTISCIPGTYRLTLAPLPAGHGNAASSGPLVSPGTGAAKPSLPPAYLSAGETPWMLTISEATREEKLVVRANSPK